MRKAYVVFTENKDVPISLYHFERQFHYIVLDKKYLNDCIKKIKHEYPEEYFNENEIRWEYVTLYNDEPKRNYGYLVVRSSKDYVGKEFNRAICVTKSLVEAITQIGVDRQVVISNLKFKVDTSTASLCDITNSGLNDTYDFYKLDVFTSYDADYHKYFKSAIENIAVAKTEG